MKNSEVVIGEKYVSRVSGNITVVEILDKGHPKGWIAKNLRTGREVHFKTGGRLWHKATESSMETYVGSSPIEKFARLDNPRCEGLVDIIKQMEAGATLPNAEPIPEATATVFDRIAVEEWKPRVKVVKPPINFSIYYLAKIIIDLVGSDNAHDIHYKKGLPFERCEEIKRIRNKLVNIFK